jgi:hypothetical protein
VTTAAVVGTGSAGTRHEKNLLRAGVAVVLVSRAGAAERTLDARSVRVERLEDALRHVDIVVIATPTSMHFELLRRCIELGRHVLCEKPASTTADGVRQSLRRTRPGWSSRCGVRCSDRSASTSRSPGRSAHCGVGLLRRNPQPLPATSGRTLWWT